MLMTIQDAAATLQVSKSTVKRLVASRALASVQVGSARRIQPADLAAYLAANTTPAAPRHRQPGISPLS